MLGSRLLVDGAVNIAARLGVPDVVRTAYVRARQISERHLVACIQPGGIVERVKFPFACGADDDGNHSREDRDRAAVENLTVADKLILKFNGTYRQFTSGKR